MRHPAAGGRGREAARMAGHQRGAAWRVAALRLLLLAVTPRPSSGDGAASESWDSSALQALDSTLCSVERISAAALSPERFRTEFRGKKPVVIRGLTNGDGAHHDSRWAAHDRWQKAELLRVYGERSVAVREDSEVDRQRQANGLGGSRRISLSDYIAQTFDGARPPPDAPLSRLGDVTYQFDRNFLKSSAREMMGDFITPPHFQHLQGGEGEGADESSTGCASPALSPLPIIFSYKSEKSLCGTAHRG